MAEETQALSKEEYFLHVAEKVPRGSSPWTEYGTLAPAAAMPEDGAPPTRPDYTPQ